MSGSLGIILAFLALLPDFRIQAGAGVDPQKAEPPVKLLVAPDAVLMAAMTVGAGSPRWMGVSAMLLAGGEDHFQVWSLEGTWSTARGRRLRAVAELACSPAPAFTLPLTAALQIHGGQSLDFWIVTDPTVLKRVPASVLSLVRDDRGIPSIKEDDQEVGAYWQTILLASRTDGAVLSAAVRHDLTRADLMNQPLKNRGQVVRLSGRLARLRKIDPAPMAAQAGIPVIYEAWIVNEAYGANPACALIVDLPPGIVPGETLDEPVEVDGYFFKRYRYQSAGPGPDGTPYRKAPLIIGRQLLRGSQPVDSQDDRLWVSHLLPWLLVVLLGSGALVAGLTYWLHRGDERVRRRVRELRGQRITQFLESGAQWPESPVGGNNQQNHQQNNQQNNQENHQQDIQQKKRWITPSEN